MTRAKTTQPQRLARPGTPRSMATLWADMHGDPTESPPAAMQVLARLNGVVNTLGKTGAKPFDVRFGNLTGAPAATDLSGRRVGITAEPLRAGESVLNTRLSRMGVVTGLAVHEAGHVLLSGPHSNAVKTRIEFYARRRYGGTRAAAETSQRHVRWVKHGHHLSNLLDDVELEAYWEVTLPAYGPLFALVSWYLYEKDIQSAGPKALRAYDRMPRTMDEGWALAVAAVRYGDQCQFVGDDVLAEVKWWQAWARRGTKVPAGFTVTSPPQHLRAIQGGLDRMQGYVDAAPPIPEPEPQPEPITEPEPQPGDDDEGGITEPWPGEGDDEGEGDEDGGEGEGLSRRREPDGEDEGDESDEDGEPETTDPCTCGCRAAVAHQFIPIQPTCTDPGCECHGGTDMTGGQDGWAPGEPDDQPDEDEDEEPDGEDGDGEGDADDDLDGEDNESDGEGDDGEGEDNGEGDGDVDLDGEDGEGSDEGQESSVEADGERGGTSVPTPHTDPDNVDGYDNPLDSHVETNEADEDLAARVDPFIDAIRNGRRSIRVKFDGDRAYTEEVTIDPVVRRETYRVDVPQDLVNALTTAYKTSRRSEHPSPARSGRLAPRRLARLWTDETPRVFFAPDESGGNDPLAIHLLIDASSSMDATQMGAAKQVVAALVQAMQRERHVRFRVWGFSGTQAPNLDTLSRSIYDRVNDCWLQDAWDSRSGQSLTGGLGALKGEGGTPTAGAVMATGLVARDEAQPKDRTLIVVLTDGAPNLASGQGLPGVVDKVRRMGIDVVALGIGTVPSQTKYFGADAWIPWSKDWTTLGVTVAGLLGKYLIKR